VRFSLWGKKEAARRIGAAALITAPILSKRASPLSSFGKKYTAVCPNGTLSAFNYFSFSPLFLPYFIFQKKIFSTAIQL
jgi:hypothetical protein